jgi:hypothetical protein
MPWSVALLLLLLLLLLLHSCYRTLTLLLPFLPNLLFDFLAQVLPLTVPAAPG